MKQAGALVTALVFVGWSMWNLRNLFRIVTGLRDRSWQGPLWWARLCSVALFAGFATWIWAEFRTGLDEHDTCQFVHHEYYDAAYADAHAAEFRKLFPLHDKCNAQFDLVPSWVNPFLVVCAVVVTAAVAVLLRFGITHLTRRTRCVLRLPACAKIKSSRTMIGESPVTSARSTAHGKTQRPAGPRSDSSQRDGASGN
jgi:hypothetical protein